MHDQLETNMCGHCWRAKVLLTFPWMHTQNGSFFFFYYEKLMWETTCNSKSSKQSVWRGNKEPEYIKFVRQWWVRLSRMLILVITADSGITFTAQFIFLTIFLLLFLGLSQKMVLFYHHNWAIIYKGLRTSGLSKWHRTVACGFNVGVGHVDNGIITWQPFINDLTGVTWHSQSTTLELQVYAHVRSRSQR